MQRDLVLRAGIGDHDAFASLATNAYGRLHRTAQLILRREDLASDAVQEALASAWLHIRAVRDPDRFDAWLNRLVVRACYQELRREKRRPIQVQVDSINEPGIDDSTSALADRDQLERGFQHLTVEHRAVLVVHHYLGLPEAEAATVLDVPMGTYKSRLHRAHLSLRGPRVRSARGRDRPGVPRMTTQNDLDRTLGAWFHGDATTTPPPEPLARAIEATRNVRPRPALVAGIGGAWVSSGGATGARGGIARLRPALVVALVALLALALAGGALLVGSRLLPPPPTPHVYLDELVAAPDLPTPMGAPTVATLLDGRVLLMTNSRLPNTALLYDPSTGVSIPVGPLVSPDRMLGSAVRLRDGRVLVTGDGVSEVFDPTTLQFAPVGPMVTARSFPGLAPLPDGRVLVAGGAQPGGETRLRSAELFDPDTLSFSPTGAMSFDGGPMGTLPDGRVFIASSPNAEVYDPRSGTFAVAGVIPGGVTGTTALPDGRVVIIGVTGLQSGGYVGMWDPTGQTYRQLYVGSHPLFAATLLDDGRVLVTGGRGTAWAGVLDPATEQMTSVSAPAATRPAATRLLDGRVLIVGGLETALPTVQIFQ